MPKRKKREMPAVGSVFERTYNGKLFRLKVVNRDGGLGFQLGTSVFNTPTAAAKSLVKAEVNGWAFWKMDKS